MAVILTVVCVPILCAMLLLAGMLGVWELVVLGVVMAIVIIIVIVRPFVVIARRYAEFVDNHPECVWHPLANALTTSYRMGCPPDWEKALAVLGGSPSNRARILCFGDFDVPKVEELRFEPEIITAMEATKPGIGLLGVLLAWFTLWLLSYVSWLPMQWAVLCRSVRPSLAWLAVAVVAAVIAGLSFWRYAMRPRYIRMVPGLIDAMEFRLGNRRATVRSYPLVAGTTVLLSKTGRNKLAVDVVREQHHDRFFIAGTQRGELQKERLWQALLSTAPTPKMSDDALLERV